MKPMDPWDRDIRASDVPVIMKSFRTLMTCCLKTSRI